MHNFPVYYVYDWKVWGGATYLEIFFSWWFSRMHIMWICHYNVGKTNRLKQNGNENIWCHQNMNRKKCVYFDNDPTIINVYLKKDVAVQISKRKCTLGSYKAFPFFCQKTVFLYFENIISPSKRTSRCRIWVTSPLAAKISCCLTRCSFVFLC